MFFFFERLEILGKLISFGRDLLEVMLGLYVFVIFRIIDFDSYEQYEIDFVKNLFWDDFQNEITNFKILRECCK